MSEALDGAGLSDIVLGQSRNQSQSSALPPASISLNSLKRCGWPGWGQSQGSEAQKVLLRWGLDRKLGNPVPYCITAWGSGDPKDGICWVVSVAPWDPLSQTRGCAGPLQAGLSELGGLGVLSLLLLDLSHPIPAPPFSLPLWCPLAALGTPCSKRNQGLRWPEPQPQVLGLDGPCSYRWVRPGHRGCAPWVTRSRRGRMRQKCTPNALPCQVMTSGWGGVFEVFLCV